MASPAQHGSWNPKGAEPGVRCMRKSNTVLFA